MNVIAVSQFKWYFMKRHQLSLREGGTFASTSGGKTNCRFGWFVFYSSKPKVDFSVLKENSEKPTSGCEGETENRLSLPKH